MRGTCCEGRTEITRIMIYKDYEILRMGYIRIRMNED